MNKARRKMATEGCRWQKALRGRRQKEAEIRKRHKVGGWWWHMSVERRWRQKVETNRRQDAAGGDRRQTTTGDGGTLKAA